MMTIRGNRYSAKEFRPGMTIITNEYVAGTVHDNHGKNVLRRYKICTVDVRRVDRIWFTVEREDGEFEVKSWGTLMLYEVKGRG